MADIDTKKIVNKPIYLDYHATTPVDPRVVDRMVYYMTTAFGNASSVDHVYGDEADQAISLAKKQVANLVSSLPKEIIFTSGATESINLAIQGLIKKTSNFKHKSRIAVMPIEHKAVLDTCYAMEKQGLAKIIELKIDSLGRIDLDYVKKVCAKGLSLLCVMAANNEIGNIYPIEEIGYIAQQYDIPFLCDASQAVGKIPLNFKEWGISYLAISAHKLYGPKGVGALVVRKELNLEPIIFGGGHQNGMRSGTLNVPGIVGLGEACWLRQLEMEIDEKIIAMKRDNLQNLLQSRIPGLIVNGDQNSRLAGNLHISIPGTSNNVVITKLRAKLAISTGAACTSGIETPSHVLTALKLPANEIEGALRISVGKFTTEDEIDFANGLIFNAIIENLLLI